MNQNNPGVGKPVSIPSGFAYRTVSVETMRAAAQHDDLDDVCAPIQAEAGIPYGDGAGQFFSGREEEWLELNVDQRVALIKQWLDLEESLALQDRPSVVPAVRSGSRPPSS